MEPLADATTSQRSEQLTLTALPAFHSLSRPRLRALRCLMTRFLAIFAGVSVDTLGGAVTVTMVSLTTVAALPGLLDGLHVFLLAALANVAQF
jgi:hypothetical protein